MHAVSTCTEQESESERGVAQCTTERARARHACLGVAGARDSHQWCLLAAPACGIDEHSARTGDDRYTRTPTRSHRPVHAARIALAVGRRLSNDSLLAAGELRTDSKHQQSTALLSLPLYSAASGHLCWLALVRLVASPAVRRLLSSLLLLSSAAVGMELSKITWRNAAGERQHPMQAHLLVLFLHA